VKDAGAAVSGSCKRRRMRRGPGWGDGGAWPNLAELRYVIAHEVPDVFASYFAVAFGGHSVDWFHGGYWTVWYIIFGLLFLVG
jgi:hypothetical protein